MEDENNTITDDGESTRHIMFILLLIIEIPSILCTLLILIYTICHWRLIVIKTLHHHAILILIIVSFFYITLDLPFTISSYNLNYDYFRTPSFCSWWYWIDYTLLATSLSVTTITSIQRHILIFHPYLLRVKKTRWLLHYIPLIIFTFYPSIFYIVFIFIYPCETIFDEESLTCPYPCYSDNMTLYNIDWAINYISPVIIIVLANSVLIARTMRIRRRARGRSVNLWKTQRRLALQLFSVSLLYILGWGASLCISIIQTYFVPDLYDINPPLYYINNASYFVCPLQPFIVIFGIPELIQFIKIKLKRILPNRTVTPAITNSTNR